MPPSAGLQLPPLGLYIHIPWCERKCPYCDFNSHAAPQQLPETEYIASLLREIGRQHAAIQDRPVNSVFFGGGTPSLFSPSSIARILDQLGRHLKWSSDLEITLEANPGTVDQQRFAGFLAAGVNRLSIGAQSFDDRCLNALGRIHDGKAARSAIAAAQRAGFERVNVDLMFGLPGQDAKQACADLGTALSLGVEHISWYELTIEPNTTFYTSPPPLPDESSLATIEASGRGLLEAAGYERYEISAYSQAGGHCRHNLNYWQFGDYLGLGAGAHSKITDLHSGRIYRSWNTRVPADYLGTGNEGPADRRWLTEQQLPLEFMMNALRLTAGVSVECYEGYTGLPVQPLMPLLTQLRLDGLLAEGSKTLRTTALGNRYLDSVLQQF